MKDDKSKTFHAYLEERFGMITRRIAAGIMRTHIDAWHKGQSPSIDKRSTIQETTLRNIVRSEVNDTLRDYFGKTH